VEDMKAARVSISEAAEESSSAGGLVDGPARSSGKTTRDEFVSRCSPEDRAYYEQLFQHVANAGIRFWMGEKGFSISRIVWGYPTHECRRHGLYLQMEQVPERNLEAVRRVLAADAGLDLSSLKPGENPQFAAGRLPVETVVRIVETALARK
jgi:hypothetical protein